MLVPQQSPRHDHGHYHVAAVVRNVRKFDDLYDAMPVRKNLGGLPAARRQGRVAPRLVRWRHHQEAPQSSEGNNLARRGKKAAATWFWRQSNNKGPPPGVTN